LQGLRLEIGNPAAEGSLTSEMKTVFGRGAA
jgi:hypothetical protein